MENTKKAVYGRWFRSTSSEGYPAKTQVAIMDTGLVYIRQTWLFPWDYDAGNGLTLLYVRWGKVLVEKETVFKLDSFATISHFVGEAIPLLNTEDILL